MGLVKVDSIQVIGNVIEDYNKLRYEKIKYLEGRPLNANGKIICGECNEEMKSPLGMYNGYSDCEDDGDFCYRSYSYECSNFHNYSWIEY